jgi:hypothetical protein
MTELEIIPHPDEQRSLAELRSEFRASALASLRSQYTSHHQMGWSMTGDPAASRPHYSSEQWAYEMDRHLLDPVTQDFGLGAAHTWSARLEKEAIAALEHDSVTWADGTEGVVDHDSPACADVTTMSDDDLADYVDRSIKESEALTCDLCEKKKPDVKVIHDPLVMDDGETMSVCDDCEEWRKG